MRRSGNYLIIFCFLCFIVIGCATEAKKEIPTEEIRGRADRAFDELKSEETGVKTSKKEERSATRKAPVSSVEEKEKGVHIVRGEKPDWVDGDSIQYPSSQYLTGVGYDLDRKSAEDKARAEIAKIFVSSIDSRTRSYQDYLQITSKRKSKTEETYSIQDITKVSTKKVLSGVRIAQVYQETGQQPRLYALAVLDRDQSSKILRYKIQELDQDIQALLSRAQGEEDVLAKVKYLKQSVQQHVMREAYDAELRIVDQSGMGISPPIHFTEIKSRLDSILLRDFLIGVLVTGNRADEVQDALVQGLNQQGFSVSEDLNRANVLVKGNVEIKPLQRGTSEWKYVQWRAHFDMTDKKGGSIFGSVNKTGRQGHLNLQQAENRAVRDIQKVLTTEMAEEMKRYIFSQ
jgi:hypothetical protein